MLPRAAAAATASTAASPAAAASSASSASSSSGSGSGSGSGSSSSSGSAAAVGYEIVRAELRHLEAIMDLFRETSDYHIDLDPHYYVSQLQQQRPPAGDIATHAPLDSFLWRGAAAAAAVSSLCERCGCGSGRGWLSLLSACLLPSASFADSFPCCLLPRLRLFLPGRFFGRFLRGAAALPVD
jgi:hypothetical protein